MDCLLGNPRLDLVIAGSQTLNCFQNPCSEMTCDAGSTCINGAVARAAAMSSVVKLIAVSMAHAPSTVTDSPRLNASNSLLNFYRSVYFRPATESEITQMVTFAEAQLANEGPDGQSRNQTITKMVKPPG